MHTFEIQISDYSRYLVEVKQQQIEIQDYRDFWKEFGNAIQANDTSKIKLLVNAPFNLLGREDQDPNSKINTNEIMKSIRTIAYPDPMAVNQQKAYRLD